VGNKVENRSDTAKVVKFTRFIHSIYQNPTFKPLKPLISFFKINTVYKFFLWFLLFWAIRLPILIQGMPPLNMEVNWWIVAEKLWKGYSLYTQVWDDMSPLSAVIYMLVYALFGKSYLALHTLTALIIWGQAVLLHQILQNQRVFNDRTLIPVLLYGLLMSCFIDFYTLSPALMANTFLLIVIRYLLLHIQEKRRYNAVFEIGAYIGIATLFYLPSFLMLAVPVIAFMSYTATKLKDYLLMLMAFGFTLAIAFLGFYLIDSEYAFFISYFQSRLKLNPYFYINLSDLLWLFGFSTLLFIASFLASYQFKFTNNYQERSQSIVQLWFVVALLTVFTDTKVSASNFILLLPALAYCLTNFFLQMRSWVLKELIFLALMFNCLFFNYTTLYRLRLPIEIPYISWLRIEPYIPANHLITENLPNARLFTDKRIFVSGRSMSYYQNAHLATPYFNDRLAQRHLGSLRDYNILMTIYQNFRKDMPDVIVDENGRMKRVFSKMPLLAQKYQKYQNTNLYFRKGILAPK
jgi:hypothetical protein